MFAFSVDHKPEINLYLQERWDPRLELISPQATKPQLYSGLEYCPLPERDLEYHVLLEQVEDTLSYVYDLEHTSSRERFERAVIVYRQCHSHQEAARNLNTRYHVAAAWRHQYLEATKSARSRQCLLSFIWASTSAVLHGRGPPSMGTNRFYVSGTILKSRAVSCGEEHHHGASQGAGEA